MIDFRSRVVSALPDQLIQVLSRAKSWVRHTRANRVYQPVIATIFPQATNSELLVANDDAAVFRVETSATSRTILKLASTPTADELLVAEAGALDELNSLAALGAWHTLVASVEARGEHEHGTWFTQTALPGVPASRADASNRDVVAASLAALRPVHQATAEVVTATDTELARLVSEPVAVVKHWRPDHIDALTVIDNDLRRRLAGRELSLSRMHGDFAPTNVLWDNHANELTGIVDWKFSPELFPPELDLMHFPLSLIMSEYRTEYGTTVIRILDGNVAAGEAELINQAVEAGPNTFDVDLAVTLAWLQHVAFGLHKAPDLRVNPIWLNNNIDTVITRLAAKPSST